MLDHASLTMDWAASKLRCIPLASSKQHFWRKALATVGEALVSHADEKHTEATFQVKFPWDCNTDLLSEKHGVLAAFCRL